MSIYYVTVSGSGDNSGGTWANAMAASDFFTNFPSAVAGDIYYVAGGTYTLTGNVSSSNSGTLDNHISLIGVNSGTTNEPPVLSDFASGASRPNFTVGTSNYMSLGSHFTALNFTVSGGSALTNYMFHLGYYGIVANCSFVCDSTEDTAKAFDGGAYGQIITSGFSCPNGNGFYNMNTAYVYGCRFYDSLWGLRMGSYCQVLNSAIYGCTGGIDSGRKAVLMQLTINDCDTGILDADDYNITLLNSSISNCTDGFKSNNSGVVPNGNLIDYNNWYLNSHDMSWDNGTTEDNSAKGLHDISVNPAYTDAANGDFTLLTGSGLVNSGIGTQFEAA